MISRRKVVLAFAAGALAAPLTAFAQIAEPLPRIGLLYIRTAATSHYVDAFREGMRAQGYVEGKNVRIDERFVDHYDGLAAAAAGLVREKASVIFAIGSSAALAVQKATRNTPTVMVGGGDPVKLGIAASLSRPGGNVTGISSMSVELAGKRLQLLKESAPSVRRVAALLYSGSRAEVDALRHYESAARTRITS